MFIQTETTPNPQTLKFLPGVEVMKSGTAFFTSREEAARSPLAKHLFDTEGVHAVFFGRDFISITKDELTEWSVLKAPLLTTIMEHFVACRPVLSEDTAPRAEVLDVNESDIVRQIRELIDTRVRPAVAQDGGDIVFHGFENGVVKLEMHGACSGCPSSTATLKQGIENMLKHYVPEVVAVEAVS
jgi:Fe-S cluster biogenesis protein NfuA